MIKVFFSSKDVNKLKKVGNEELGKDLKKQLTSYQLHDNSLT